MPIRRPVTAQLALVPLIFDFSVQDARDRNIRAIEKLARQDKRLKLPSEPLRIGS